MLKNVALTLAPALMGAIIATSGYTSAFGIAAVLGISYGLAIALRFRPAPEVFNG